MTARWSLLVLGLLLTVGSALAASEWPMYHLNAANTGSMGENPSSDGFQPWVVEGDSSPNEGGPIVVDGTLYVSGPGIRAYDARTGALKWIRTDQSSAHSAAYAHGLLYVAGNRSITALNPEDGREVWRFRFQDAAQTNPAVAGGIVYAATLLGQLYAVDALNGTLRWTVALEQAEGPSAVLVAEGTVIVSTSRGSVHAIDAITGHVRWVHPPGPPNPDRYPDNSIPVAVDGVVYVAGLVHPLATLTAFDIATGEILWTFNEPAAGGTAPAAADGRILLSCHGTSFCAVDAKTGKRLWRTPACDTSADGAVIAEGIAYIDIGCGKLYALDTATGDILRVYKYAGTWVWGTPAYANGVLYFQYHVFDYDPPIGTGEPIRQWNMTALPVRVGNTLLPGAPLPPPTLDLDFPWALALLAAGIVGLRSKRKPA